MLSVVFVVHTMRFYTAWYEIFWSGCSIVKDFYQYLLFSCVNLQIMLCVICSRPNENPEDEDVNEQRCKQRKIEKPEVQRFFTSDRKWSMVSVVSVTCWKWSVLVISYLHHLLSRRFTVSFLGSICDYVNAAMLLCRFSKLQPNISLCRCVVLSNLH